jgi:hypothetical protein
MRPGEQQPGAGQNPQWSNPYQQPGYQQPNPYQQPTAQWQGAGMPPSGDGGGRKGRTAIAIVVTAAVVAAAVITGVVLLGGDDKDDTNAKGKETAEPTEDPVDKEEADEKDDESDADDPRRGPQQKPDPVVAPDWQVQTIAKRYNAFDVPPDWKVNSEGFMVGFEDTREGHDPEPLVIMSAASTYKDKWCGNASRAMAGTKGGQGATGTAEAAENEAMNWALSGYDQEQLGTLKVSDPEPFESEHGISGHTSTATIKDVPADPEAKCEAADGKVVTVSYLDAKNDLATWVLITDTGVDDEVDDATIEKIMNSLRPYNS